MNKQLLTGLVIGGLAATALVGVAGIGMMNSDDYAEVIDVRPVTREVSVPREECRQELVTVQKPVVDKHQIAGTVAGAVIGGVLGSKVGDGSGQDLATAGGAIAGGYAGNKIQEKVQENAREQDLRTVCDTVYDRYQEPAGFEVTYVHDGEERTIVTDEDPGSRIRIENGVPAKDG